MSPTMLPLWRPVSALAHRSVASRRSVAEFARGMDGMNTTNPPRAADGLSSQEAARRLQIDGPNTMADIAASPYSAHCTNSGPRLLFASRAYER
jgi:hypothetical protein